MRRTILTIEDKPDIRRLICMTLEFNGHRVLEAADGETGLRMARSERPDLILLDVMMPGISGIDVARQLGADPDLARIPTVMISALGASTDVDAGLSTGVHAYLVKPFSPWELLEIVERLTASGDSTVASQPPAGAAAAPPPPASPAAAPVPLHRA